MTKAKVVQLCRYCREPVERPKLVHPTCGTAARREKAEVARDQLRRCGKCRKVKPPNAYSDDSTRSTGKFPYCKECQNKYNIENKFQDAEAELNGHICPLCDTPIRGHANRRFCGAKCKERVAALRTRFDLTVEQYREMVAATGGRCPICKRRCFAWQVDHDHSTGRVTGVVCAPCNVGLLADSHHKVERVQALLDYLFETPAERLGIIVTVPEEMRQPKSNLHKMWSRGKR